MPRTKRIFISREHGSHHLYSQVVGASFLFGAAEKEHLLELLERLTLGFYIEVHGFAFMSNHIHLIVTEREEQARKADYPELLKRYRRMCGRKSEPPAGRHLADGSEEPDEDGGEERLRKRLMSISRFMQEFKQSFSRWYNHRHHRKGYLWSERYGDKILERGDHELVCQSYIDLNAIRAGLVKVPDRYRWSGIGLRVRSPKRCQKLLSPFPGVESRPEGEFDWYRLYVYHSGGIEVPGKASIDPELVRSVEECHGRLGIGDLLRFRARNLTEGLALGSREFIEKHQRLLKRKHIVARRLLEGCELFVTRVLRSP